MLKLRIFTLFVVLLSTHLTLGWDAAFKFTQCYERRMDERMPLSIDNLIAIVEGYERNQFNNDPADIANSILYRYHRSGVIFDPNERTMWSLKQKEEITKQKLDDLLLKPSLEFPEDSFQHREECSLHMMLSHSTDDYPHAGVAYPWENNNYYSRKRRSTKERYVVLPDGVEPADHPIENGVMQTRAGPVSGRLLLAGLINIDRSDSYTVGVLVGSEKAKSYMPSEMISKTVDALYGSTISGELAQAALLSGKTVDSNSFEIGPFGMFGNCTACARLYSLENNDFSYISRAEVFGALDGFIIARYLNDRSSSSQSLKLSEILRMYYGNHGLYNPEVKACNRKNLFNKYQGSVKNEIVEQALNYMYAYQDQYDDVQAMVASYQDEFDLIETEFKEYLDPVVSKFFSFMSSYSYDDPGYEQCPIYTTDDVMAETQADLVVIYSPSGGITDITKQMEYISLVARYIGVGYHRSRLAVLNGKTEEFLSPMTNYSNVADYACNYTTLTNFASSSSQDFLEIMDKLTTFYNVYYSYLRQEDNLDMTGKHSQVVLWNLPSSFDGDEEDMLNAWDVFNMTFPDVTFIFAGTKDSQLDLFYNNERDNEGEEIFISTLSISPEEIAREIADEIQRAPRMFVYAACDTLMVAYSGYNEDSHVYSGYVTPNYTTFLRIPPQNFHFSEYVKLMFDTDDTRVCLSRVNQRPYDNDDTSETYCEDTPYEYEQREMCGRYVENCNPIYISVRGSSDSNIIGCTDEECQYPNQINFEMRHEGMICGVWGMLPSKWLLLGLFVLTALSRS